MPKFPRLLIVPAMALLTGCPPLLDFDTQLSAASPLVGKHVVIHFIEDAQLDGSGRPLLTDASYMHARIIDSTNSQFTFRAERTCDTHSVLTVVAWVDLDSSSSLAGAEIEVAAAARPDGNDLVRVQSNVDISCNGQESLTIDLR